MHYFKEASYSGHKQIQWTRTSVWHLINMQNVSNHASDRPTFQIAPCHWQTQKKILKFQHSVRGGYYTTLGYEVVRDVFVLFMSA